jgi:hypothetical protein
MTAVSLAAARFAEGDFRIGRVLGRTSLITTRAWPGKASIPRRSRRCSNDVAFDGAALPLHNTTALEEHDFRHR